VPELTDEQTREAFAGLRADALPLIQPPGAARAARTVRRRRRAGLAAVAAGVGVVTAGATLIPLASGRGADVAPAASPLVTPTAASAAPSATATPYPSRPGRSLNPGYTPELSALARRAGEALGLHPAPTRNRDGKPRMMSEAPIEEGRRVGNGGGTGGGPGTYTLEVTCAGKGTLTAHFYSSPTDWPGTIAVPEPGPDEQVARVPCSDQPKIVRLRLTLTSDDRMVHERVDPDEVASGQAGYAILVRVR
jgi:hypothetical protein